MFGKTPNPVPSTAPATPPVSAADTYDPYAAIANAQGSQGGVYPLAGVYPLLYIDTLKMKKNRKNETIFIAEIEIVQSNVPDRPAGSRMTYLANFKQDAATGNVKAMIAAIANHPIDQISPDNIRYALDDENPMHGRLVRLEASMIKTRANKDFTKCIWIPIADDIQAKATELRKAAGFI